MPITPPVPGQEVSTSLWGVPITNEVNQLRTDLTATTGVANGKVAKAGDTMTGDLTVAKASPSLVLDATGTNDSGVVVFRDGGIGRWLLYRDGAAGDFVIRRNSAAGATVDFPIIISAADGKVTLAGAPTAAGHAAHKSYVDTADALRLLLTGGTLTGNLLVAKNAPEVNLDATGTDDSSTIRFKDGGVDRWRFFRYGPDGSLNFQRLDATGVVLNTLLALSAADGSVGLTGATAVTVPTPTAATHAARKDYVDTADGLRVLKAGDTMAGDLTVAKATPVIYINATGVNDTGWLTFRDDGVNRWMMLREGATGNLRIARADAAGTILDYPITVRTSDGKVEVPPITGANQAAQVTAYDANTGRLAIGGREIGDTGWRELARWDAAGTFISGSLGAPFVPRTGSAGWVMIRRNGYTTTVMAKNLQTSAAMAAGSGFSLIPTLVNGFGSNLVTPPCPWVIQADAPKVTGYVSASVTLVPFVAIPADGVLAFNAAAAVMTVPLADHPWPTVLPGIAGTPN